MHLHPTHPPYPPTVMPPGLSPVNQWPDPARGSYSTTYPSVPSGSIAPPPVPAATGNNEPPNTSGSKERAINRVLWTRLTGFACVVLLLLGLSMPFDAGNAWTTQTAWAVFALAASIVALLPTFTAHGAVSRSWWLAGAIGAAGVFTYWLLIVLPSVSTNQGFILTLATASAAAATWLSPARPR